MALALLPRRRGFPLFFFFLFRKSSTVPCADLSAHAMAPSAHPARVHNRQTEKSIESLVAFVDQVDSSSYDNVTRMFDWLTRTVDDLDILRRVFGTVIDMLLPKSDTLWFKVLDWIFMCVYVGGGVPAKRQYYGGE